ncbi:peptide ABC transporter permease [Methylobacterium oryzihabitans]|uniref:Peptide ABC transporter permease n=1 Tax=Methylobacterium oryzihabitans TaxID=2499852 RepID=A0A3S2YU73_9HYPH|nr:peptide ABC transporter permease [Methylobacterium oryzihabitans]RVU19496.1 peptide ABC transporter permease [Methylobacterium oryzihabitans]
MPRPPASAPSDPAADAAALLRRIGFFGLLVLLPLAALVSRRAIVILVPIGLALLILAAFIDGGGVRPVAAGLTRILASRAAIAGGILAGWCALSLIWTPFPGPAGERLLNFAATVGLTIAGYVALPERMRSANLYLLPLGVGLAGLGGAVLGPFGGAILPAGFDDDSALERAAMLIALLLWPAVAWLRSRHRNAGALAVAVAAALALALAPRAIPLLSLAAGAAAYALATWDLRRGVRVVAGLAAGLVALGPALPFLLRPLLAPLLGAADPTVQSLKVWMRIVTGEPLRLITGHGFETALRGRMVGLLAPNAPSSLLFEIWYELGIVGAFAAAFLLWGAIRQSGRDHPVLTPGAIGTAATAFASACLGIGTTTAWWVTSVALAVLVFIAVERGQFRTARPKASALPTLKAR